MLEHAVAALGHVIRPDNFLFLLLGVFGGMVVGALPGLTATMALALLVPFTFTMKPETALVMLGGLYTAAMYADAIPAILINTPGTPSAVATAFDGYPMSRQGRAQEALAAAAIASGLGGLIGGVFLLFLSPPLAEFGLRFGPPEYFWLAVFGLTIIATLAADSLLKGLAGGAIGLLISAVGIAPIGGDVRFTFGRPQLQAGITLVVALIGLFCIPQVLAMMEEHRRRAQATDYQERTGVFWRVFSDIVRRPANLIRSSLIGTVVGIIPGAGGSIASLISYNEATRWSRNRDSFGKGNPDGVVASEAANNAQVPGALIPMLTLGIPGAPPAAVVMGTLLLHGLRPGRDLFTVHSHIVYTFIFSLFAGAISTMAVGGVGSRYFARLIGVPIRYVAPIVAFLSFIGAYAIRNNMTDVGIMLFFGLFGYAALKLGFHPGPIVLGLILGPYAEQGLVQTILMGRASGSVLKLFFGRPISLILVGLCVLSALWPLLARALGHSGSAESKSTDDPPPPSAALRTMNTDLWAGLLVLVIGGIALYHSRRFSELGGLFVHAVSLVCLVLGTALVVVSARGVSRGELIDRAMDGGAVLGAAAALLAYGALINTAGFVVSSLLFVMGLSTFLSRRAGLTMQPGVLFLCASVVVGLSLLFQHVFAVPLPAGALWGGLAGGGL